jgi:hypothetical protein
MFCPLLNNECKGEECMLYIVTQQRVVLGCAIAVTARQLDKLAFYFKPEQFSSTRKPERETEGRDPFG